MVNQAHSVQEELFPSIATRLDEARGVIDVAMLEEFSFEEERRTNIATLAGLIGLALADVPRESQGTDRALRVYRDDFWHASVDCLSSGLYVPPSSQRYYTADSLVKLASEPCDLDLPGVVPQRIGVVVGNGEFKTIARSAADLAAHSRAVTRDANSGNMNREDTEEKAKRSAGHTMDSKLVALENLDTSLSEQRAILLDIFRDARIVWRTTYNGKKLDVKRKLADDLIHDTAEISLTSLGYGTTVVNAAHRALVSNLYRRGSSEELATSWRDYTAWVGRYINAKRGKISQSRKACERERVKYAKFLVQPT